MATSVERGEIPFGARGDGLPWSIATYVVDGGLPGPRTGIVAGVWGDKPLGILAAHRLIETLAMRNDIRGSVVVIPAANVAALELGSRMGPDALLLNRRFPGSSTGFITDQTAHHLLGYLEKRCDAVLDLHSGTPTMRLHYAYDYGNPELSASTGLLPVIVGRGHPTQLSAVLAARGIPSCLAEFGGGARADVTEGTTIALNFLRVRGHLDEPLLGVTMVPRIAEVTLALSSTTGIWQTARHLEVGSLVSAGAIGVVVGPQTGTEQEGFLTDRNGVLLMLTSAPSMVQPGSFLFMVGYPDGEVTVPRAGEWERLKG
jgi:predicted deacylase